ncbi:MAG: N-acetylmuramoyl-L-alanine amidase [Bdellovibrionales bacterium]|nr:N-acetylmuramoyl-L-alanine amidase [Bdellovibrionales bacterium]
MSIQPLQSHISPNYSPQQITVEFVVIHFTAASIKKTLEILTDPISKVSAHIVIAPDGGVFELVPCWNGVVSKAWHAGKSEVVVEDKIWSSFNDFSVGIELVNLNGNVFDYTEEQYKSLIDVLRHFKELYPNLRSASRIIGHEQIAGMRGKCDPGTHFDWQRVFTEVYPAESAPERLSICGAGASLALKGLACCLPKSGGLADLVWMRISSFLEWVHADINRAQS